MLLMLGGGGFDSVGGFRRHSIRFNITAMHVDNVSDSKVAADGQQRRSDTSLGTKHTILKCGIRTCLQQHIFSCPLFRYLPALEHYHFVGCWQFHSDFHFNSLYSNNRNCCWLLDNSKLHSVPLWFLFLPTK